jgi:tRNA threonylcarbamoyladenosine biosynthesis protein TsaB
MTQPVGPLLALDTSTTAGSVAVGDGRRVLAEVTLGLSGQHSTALMPAVDAAVRWAGLAPADLRGVAVGGGPGSFTGLRIGAATAKGIVATLGLPLWSYSGLLVAAAGCAVARPEADAPVCALFDARRRDVYAACYRFGRGEGGAVRVEEVFGPEALAVDELLDRFRGGPPPLFTGDGALLHAAEIERELGAAIAPPHMALPRAAALLWLVEVAPEAGRVADPAAWEPEYVRAAGAERIAEARRAGT